MKKLSVICMAALLLLAASCKKEKKIELGDGMGFRATTEAHGGNSKTHLDGLKVIWDMNDEILVCSSNGGQYAAQKTFEATEVDGSTAVFSSGSAVEEAFFTAPYKAYYPASGIVDASHPDQITLPATQTYAANSFARGANPMAAKANDVELAFKNICGVLQLTLQSTSPCTVTSIAVTTKGNENLCGTGTVGLTNPDEPTLGALTNGGKTVTLDCSHETGGGVDISSENVVFRIVVPAGSLGDSFEVKLTDSDGKVWKRTATGSQNVIERNTITKLEADGISTQPPVTPSSVTITAGCVNCAYTLGGSFMVPTGTHTCEYGFVYSETNNRPTIADTKIPVNIESLSSGKKEFTANLPALTFGTNYYFRAYAMIDGVAYSSSVENVVVDEPEPLSSNWEHGRSPYPFTVGSGKVVYFSQGNLQYIGSTAIPYWKFAEHQYDVLGNNGQGSTAQTVNRDLFSWGTSGYPHGATCYQPWNISNVASRYYAYGDPEKNLEDGESPNTGKADWGKANTISNGQGYNWRTLTNAEWSYLFNDRANASELYGEGSVGCTPGLIILPDGWTTTPDGVSGFFSGSSEWSNAYTYSDWAKMEAFGAVFLPAAGHNDDCTIYYVGSNGYYWSSSIYDEDAAYMLYFYSGFSSQNDYGSRCLGCSVRLVSEN